MEFLRQTLILILVLTASVICKTTPKPGPRGEKTADILRKTASKPKQKDVMSPTTLGVTTRDAYFIKDTQSHQPSTQPPKYVDKLREDVTAAPQYKSLQTSSAEMSLLTTEDPSLVDSKTARKRGNSTKEDKEAHPPHRAINRTKKTTSMKSASTRTQKSTTSSKFDDVSSGAGTTSTSERPHISVVDKTSTTYAKSVSKSRNPASTVEDDEEDLEITKRLNRPQWWEKEKRRRQELLRSRHTAVNGTDEQSATTPSGAVRSIRSTTSPRPTESQTSGSKSYGRRKYKRRRIGVSASSRITSKARLENRPSRKRKEKTRVNKGNNGGSQRRSKVRKEESREDTTEPRPYTATSSSPAISNVTTEEYCPTCGHEDMTEERVRQLRILMFRETIMQKMRLDPADLEEANRKPPRMPKLPDSVVESMMKDNTRSRYDEEDSFYAKDKEVIIPARDMGRDCIRHLRATGCYQFELEGKITRDVASAQLWWYKTRDRHDISGQTFVVYELERTREQRLRRRNLILRHESHTKEGWLSEDITRAVRRWVSKGRAEEKLAIRCKTCLTRYHKSLYGAKHGFLPLLVITYGEDYSGRRRRSEEECDPAGSCCKRPLRVNLRTLVMRSINAPEELSIGYCYGFCDQVNYHTYNHTMVKQRLRFSVENLPPEMNEQLKPCCVPVALRDVYVLTWGNEQSGSTFVQQLLPDMVVERCGCV